MQLLLAVLIVVALASIAGAAPAPRSTTALTTAEPAGKWQTSHETVPSKDMGDVQHSIQRRAVFLPVFRPVFYPVVRPLYAAGGYGARLGYGAYRYGHRAFRG